MVKRRRTKRRRKIYKLYGGDGLKRLLACSRSVAGCRFPVVLGKYANELIRSQKKRRDLEKKQRTLKKKSKKQRRNAELSKKLKKKINTSGAAASNKSSTPKVPPGLKKRPNIRHSKMTPEEKKIELQVGAKIAAALAADSGDTFSDDAQELLRGLGGGRKTRRRRRRKRKRRNKTKRHRKK